MLAMGNKYYDGLIFYIPQLCMKGSFMGEKCAEKGIGFECDPFDERFTDKVYEYYSKLKYEEFKKNCNAELNNVLADISKGKSIISECLAKG